MKGKKLAVGIEVGGRTQFLATAQPMPPEIERKIKKIVTDFIWGEGVAPKVAYETLCAPIEAGGLNLLNIKARNEAIDIMWLKEYLKIGGKRAPWTAVADNLLAKAVAAKHRNVEPVARINSFLQTWDVSTRSVAGLGTDLKRMIAAAKKYGVRCEVKNPAKELRGMMPVWYHLGEAPGRNSANTTASRCLRDRHMVETTRAQKEEQL
ncbi:hypothetical protein C8Q78DRAFT_1070352 [Trametes maxima]|nr:hypothetical protein C8Q78DRAFT_1070352 [Trametes maxima]